MYTKEMQIGKKSKKTSKNFSMKTVYEIWERDNYSCVRCGSNDLDSRPHHIIFKSQGGTGEKRNGASACIECHRLAHTKRKIRKWFEDWQEQNLDEKGDLKIGL